MRSLLDLELDQTVDAPPDSPGDITITPTEDMDE